MAAAHLIDLTRLVSRQGKGALTGVDRVELAWLDHLLTRQPPLFALLRTVPGYLLLDRRGAALVADLAHGRAIAGGNDLIGRLTRWRDPARGRAEATLRRMAIARVAPNGLARALRRAMPQGGVWLNLGHTNLTARSFAGMRGAGLRSVVMVHDTIPLDHSEFSRAGAAAAFARKLAAISAHADLVIHTAPSTRAMTEAHLSRLGRVPDGVTAPLGISVAAPDPAALPAGLDLSPPYFVALGTIEPRKNHALLLDIWARMAERAGPLPRLFIIGNRGWADPALLARFDARPRGVVEVSGLTDGAVAALVSGARALLFPSHAEGFGLPPFEAAALGTPVICSDIPAMRDHLSDYPVYVDISDSYAWMETITTYAGHKGRADGARNIELPTWEAHFNAVLTRAG